MVVCLLSIYEALGSNSNVTSKRLGDGLKFQININVTINQMYNFMYLALFL